MGVDYSAMMNDKKRKNEDLVFYEKDCKQKCIRKFDLLNSCAFLKSFSSLCRPAR